MPIKEIYSKRNAIEKVGPAITTAIPFKLKNQIFHVWDDFLSQKRIDSTTIKSVWNLIYKEVRKEHGFGKYIYSGKKNAREQVEEYYNSFSSHEVDKHLDLIEIIFSQLRRVEAHQQRQILQQPLRLTYEASVKKLNARFIENNSGYRFEQNQIIKIESQYQYADIIKPAFELLKDERFKIANQEYLSAHTYFRKGMFEPCIVECAKAFESVIKVICHELKWSYQQTDTSSTLLKTIIGKDFIPKYLESSLIGIATIRNKTAAHGKGVEDISTDQNLARLVVHQTASVVSYLADTLNSYKLKKRTN